MSEEPQKIPEAKPAGPKPLPGKPLRERVPKRLKQVVEGKGSGEDHASIIKKVRRSAVVGTLLTGATAAAEAISPGMLASVLGLAGPWGAVAGVGLSAALTTGTAYLTRSDEKDFQNKDQPTSGDAAPDSSKRSTTTTQSTPVAMPTSNSSAPAASEKKSSVRSEAASIFDDDGDAEAFGDAIDKLADLPSALESFDDTAAETLYQYAVDALDADPSQ